MNVLEDRRYKQLDSKAKDFFDFLLKSCWNDIINSTIDKNIKKKAISTINIFLSLKEFKRMYQYYWNIIKSSGSSEKFYKELKLHGFKTFEDLMIEVREKFGTKELEF